MVETLPKINRHRTRRKITLIQLIFNGGDQLYYSPPLGLMSLLILPLGDPPEYRIHALVD